MAEYVFVAPQSVALNNPIIFNASIPCNKGYIFHDDESGVFILKGVVNNPCANFARYQVTYNGNISVPEGGEVTPIGICISESGEPRLSSLAVFTPQAAEELGNVTSTAIITVPRGCCFTVSVRYIDATAADPAVTPTPVINVENSNLVITRIA